MKSSALVFLAAFIALSASWGGFVLTPQLELGRATQALTVPAQVNYPVARPGLAAQGARSEEHTSELQSHALISYAVFCLV